MARRLALCLLLAACASSGSSSGLDPRIEVELVLDDLHRLAAQADGESYFALFAEDAVFYGTDATERWSVADFRKYAEPHFSQGRGWTYTATERHVFIGDSGDVAWFDERLDNAKYGEVRGSGVLVLEGGEWKIAQYNLAFPVPNELAADLVERIRSFSSSAN